MVIAAPLLAPEENVIDALPSPGVAARLVGAAGAAAAGVTRFDGADGAVCQVASFAFVVNV